MPLDTSFLAVKAETTPGTWATPTFAANALTVRSLRIDPFNATTLRRNIEQPFAGSRPSLPSGVHRGFGFELELSGKGAGLAGSVAAWAPVLNMMLFGAAVPSASEVAYPLTSAGDGGANSLLLLKDTLMHEARGARANAVFNFTEKQTPFVAIDGLALFRTDGEVYTAGASTGIALANYAAPVEVNLANTVITLDGFTLGVREFTLDLGLSPSLYTTTNQRAIIFGKDEAKDRRGAKFTMKFELPDSASKNYSASLAAGSQIAFSLVHGVTSGNIVQLSSSSAIIETISYSSEDNRIFASVAGVLVPTGSAGNNEFTLVTK